MKQYKVVEMYSREDLEEIISTYINQGWKLQGGVCYAQTSKSKVYMQAMYLERSRLTVEDLR